MPGSLSDVQFTLLNQASPDGVAAADAADAAALCTLERLGLIARHHAGIYVLTEAGRRHIAVEGPHRGSPPASN